MNGEASDDLPAQLQLVLWSYVCRQEQRQGHTQHAAGWWQAPSGDCHVVVTTAWRLLSTILLLAAETRPDQGQLHQSHMPC